jgi:acetyltransferase-like isoleucine patch superfamily enzyme
LSGGEHHTEWNSTYPFSALCDEYSYIEGHPATKGDIVVGNDVWIASGATILSGVTIGDGAVIGCNALVTENVEPYSIVGGVPARHIKYRFSEDRIEKLKTIKWWELPEERIAQIVPLLQSDNIDELIKSIQGGD